MAVLSCSIEQWIIKACCRHSYVVFWARMQTHTHASTYTDKNTYTYAHTGTYTRKKIYLYALCNVWFRLAEVQIRFDRKRLAFKKQKLRSYKFAEREFFFWKNKSLTLLCKSRKCNTFHIRRNIKKCINYQLIKVFKN